MKIGKKASAFVALSLLALSAIIVYGYHHWYAGKPQRGDLLSMMPTDASAVIYLNLAELKQSPFLAKLFTWAPKPAADSDYLQFLHDTGFDYERDLDRAAFAIEKHEQNFTLFSVVEGRFDKKKIAAYATRAGRIEKQGANEAYSFPVNGSANHVSFVFLSEDRLAITNDSNIASSSSSLKPLQNNTDARSWKIRFDRLAGTPIFAVIRQDVATGSPLAGRMTGNVLAQRGWQSPQLSSLLDQLQWITIAAKSEGDQLRMVSEGECANEASMRQLSDLLNGVLLLMEAGLNDRKTKAQLDPMLRKVYLEMLKSAEVSTIDRGETKSVRLMFNVTPQFLEIAGSMAPMLPAPQSDVPRRRLPHRKNKAKPVQKPPITGR